MSKKVDENYFYDDKGELEEEEEDNRKCPPQLVPSLNPNEDWVASHKPEERISAYKDEAKVHEHKHHHKHHHKHKHKKSLMESSERHEGQRIIAQMPQAVAVGDAVLFDEKEEEIKGAADGHVFAASSETRNTESRRAYGGQPDYSLGAEAVDTAVAQKPEAVAIKEAVLFDEEEEIKGAADGHVFVANSDDRNTESRRAFGGQPDYSLGTEAVDTQGQPCPNATQQRCHHIQDHIFPGAFREGGPDIEEGYGEGEFTVATEEENVEQAPAVTRGHSIDPVSAELVNVAEEERRLQEKIDQALQRERQRAVVAEVAPVNDGDLPQSDAHKFGTRKRDWFVIGAIFLIVVAITTALAVILPSNCGKDGYFGPNCDLYYPNCNATYPKSQLIGNGLCDPDEFYTEECGWDGGDCCAPDDSRPICEVTGYPNCSVPVPALIGDGDCNGLPYNTEECRWDDGDCICDIGYFGPECKLYYPNCNVADPALIDNGSCDGEAYNTTECGWDGGDCIPCNAGYFGPKCNLYYPNCIVTYPDLIGNGICDDAYNTTECGLDGSDCIPCKDGYFGPKCNLYYPNCSVPFPESELIGNGYCDYSYNTTECGWEGGDCIPCNTSYFGRNCDLYYPNCSVAFPESELIGDGVCDYQYNTTECGWEGGDCIPCSDGYVGFNCDLYYPNCSVPDPAWIGDGACDAYEPYYNTEECGWDGGDCCAPDDSRPICEVTGYPNCSVLDPAWIGDGECDGEPYNVEECGWDGGDCCAPGYFGPSCKLYYPNCSVSSVDYESYAFLIGDGFCDDMYNTTECGWEGGDCIPCNTSYFGRNCDLYYPNCSVPFPESESIGDGYCDDLYNTTECGWEGGDCVPCSDGYFGFFCDLYYPNCSVPIPEFIGDGVCDGLPYDVEQCGWDGGDCPH